MKKIKLFLFAAMLLGSVGLQASNTITYTASEKLPGHNGSLDVGATTFGSAITSHTFSNGTGTITCSWEITEIGDRAFYLCSDLTSITIPNSVMEIGENAFYRCAGLASIEIPNFVTKIGEYAFYYCEGLTSITIPNSVTTMGEAVFYSCTGLTSVTIGNSVTTIEKNAFSGCTSLTSIVIPHSVTIIRNYAFYYCPNLTSISIGNSVRVIGDYAFYDCTSLTSVKVFWTDKQLIPSINSNVFGGIAHGSGPAEATLHVPSGTAALYQQADGWKDFGSMIDDVKIDKITYTATSKLSGYNGSLNVGATTFGSAIISHTFSNGTGTIICDGEMTKIGAYAFYYNSSLNSITIPNSVTTIGDDAFEHCTGLTSITIPNSVTTIGKFAFYNCSSLTSITIPTSVTTIGSRAFSDCSGLTSVTVSWIDQESIPSMSSGVFAAIANGDGPAGAKLYVPIGTKRLYLQAEVWKDFGGIESDITRINNLWFHSLNVQSLNLIANQDTTARGERIPYSGDVIINKMVGLCAIAAIEDSAFYNAKLTSLTVLTEAPLPCGEHTFMGQDKTIPVYVLDVPAYQQAKYWQEFPNILFYQPYKDAAEGRVRAALSNVPAQYANQAQQIADTYFRDIVKADTGRRVDDLTHQALEQLQVFVDQGLWQRAGSYWLLNGKELLK